MLVPRLKQTHPPELVLLSPVEDDRESTSSLAFIRLRLRKWEIRRAWSGRALVAISFPLAYLLIMGATGTPASPVAVRLMLGVWSAAVAVGAVCAEAVWRHRHRLERRLRDG